MASIFTRIIQREIPAYIVQETEHTIAFLDIQPFTPGHTLVCPRQEVVLLEDLPPEVLQAWILAIQQVARGILRGLGCGGYNLRLNNGLAAGQDVQHVHMHIMPRQAGQPLPRQGAPADPAALAEIAAKIRQALQQG